MRTSFVSSFLVTSFLERRIDGGASRWGVVSASPNPRDDLMDLRVGFVGGVSSAAADGVGAIG